VPILITDRALVACRRRRDDMVYRLLGVAGLALTVMLPIGCATRKFVREEVQKSETKVTGDVGRVEVGLNQERERITGIASQVTETRTVAEDAVGRADRAAGIATEASARAERAEGRAGEAASKADATDERLTRLWKNRNGRLLVETVAVRFGFDKADLGDGAPTALLDVVKQLQSNPSLVVDLEGYTDSTGDSAYNVLLSQRRVEAVRRFLVEKGVELHRLNSIGLGAARPVADNKTKAGRDQNRRVAVRVFGPVE
jgi:outer membrane protein OmpA-like peptidoglycan-associated protein